MARSRNIKPSIMDNEQLASLPALTRLLFIYMWMLADKEGRMEDRPGRIKKQAIGYDDGDADAMLSELQRAGFIERYEVDGRKLIQIVKFSKHQTPHVREAASELPEKVQSTAKVVPSTEQGESKPSPRSPDSGYLIPDSLIPDPLHSEAKASGVPPAPRDEKQELYAAGKSLLELRGMPKAQCGSFITKLAKDYGQEVALDAVRASVQAQPLEATQYLIATCQRLKGERKDTGPPITVPSKAADETARLLATQAAHAAQAVTGASVALRAAEIKAKLARVA